MEKRSHSKYTNEEIEKLEELEEKLEELLKINPVRLLPKDDPRNEMLIMD